MPLVKGPDAEPIPGYRLLVPLGAGGFGEVWKCEAPGGLVKAIKFVGGGAGAPGDERQQAEQEWKALQRVKDIRHPFLLAMDRVEVVAGELVIVMELADRNLDDRLRVCREAGLPGVPRDELLGYLGEAAEVLDLMNLQHNLQHLDVKPGNLFLVNNHVKVGDFGLVNGLAEGGDGGVPAGLTPLYCAPEALEGQVGCRSDQYSLAVATLELLTGKLPYTGRSFNEVMLRRATEPPDLAALPEADRAVVARALANDPNERFASCTDFVRALTTGGKLGSTAFVVVLPPDNDVSGPRGSSRPAPRPPAPRALTPLRRASDPKPLTRPAAPPLVAPESSGGQATFAGYRLVSNLSSGPLCEAWRVEGRDGRPRLLKFPCAGGDPREATRVQATQLLGSLSHPGLLPVETLAEEGGRAGLLSDFLTTTLADRFKQCRGAGQPGIPRDELLGHFLLAAETLDDVFDQYGLAHLCLNSRTLILDETRLLVGDLGVAQLFLLPSGQPLGPLNGRYAAPELFGGEPVPATDQYGLAVLFQEMLTGTFPFRGPPGRGKTQRPDVDLLPAPDRRPILRALDPDPAKRFACCRELVEALDGRGRAGGGAARKGSPALLEPVIAAPTPDGKEPPPALPAAGEIIHRLFVAATGSMQLHHSEALRYLIEPGKVLRHGCGARLSPSLARLKMEGFVQHWHAEVVQAQEEAFVFRVPLAASFWQRCLGQEPGFQLTVRLAAPQDGRRDMTEVDVEIRPTECGPTRAAELLAREAPQLLESLRTFLQVEGERRRLARVPFDHPLGVFPVLADRRLGDALVCQGKDISLQGMGLYLPEEPRWQRLYLQSTLTPELAQAALLARVVRSQRRDAGRWEVGLIFVEEPEQ